VPIFPCVVLATGAFARPTAWLPIKRTRYAVAFGQPITVPDEAAEAPAVDLLKTAYANLYAELSAASGLTLNDSPWRPERTATATDVKK